MSKPRYIYIDDENGKSEISALNGFNDLKIVEAERFPLGDFKDFSRLKLELISRIQADKFEGIIMDLRLDGAGEDRTDFNATAIAQELRSVAARGEIKSFPIILCSTEEKIKQTYNSDKTSHDLFDYKISKSNPKPDWQKRSRKLSSLALGYKSLNKTKNNLETIFGLKDLKFLDLNILDKMETLTVNYDFAHFIIKSFFHQTNPLINEKVLAARLGIDIATTSQDDWNSLTNTIFKDAKYTGLFADGWNRWWADKVNEIFASASGERLAFLNAEKRVEILKSLTNIKTLTFATPLKFCNSSEFWTICEGYRMPIDPLEAFKIYTTADLKPWQESKYISLLAILEREGFQDRGLKPHSSETERINYTKELLDIK